MSSLPCVLFEDADLLVVHKPSGIGTHAAAADGPWGIVELLQHQPLIPVKLGIHQRLDRETSGVLVFAKSAEANRSLSSQFEGRQVEKEYLFVTSHPHPLAEWTATEPIEGKPAKTFFKHLDTLPHGRHLWMAKPETGRTHQIRIHATQAGTPITGDGATSPWEPLLLHAHRLTLVHPKTKKRCAFEAPLPGYFHEDDIEKRRALSAAVLRQFLLDTGKTNAFRLLHREGDGFPGITVDSLGDWLYLEQFHRNAPIESLIEHLRVDAHRYRGLISSAVFPEAPRMEKKVLWGERPNPFLILENGVHYLLDPMATGNPGIFHDQRENRRRLMTLAQGKTVLNLFAYTCGFSVAAAMGGATETVSVDLSRNYLERGRKNFEANGLSLDTHRFLARDARQVLKQSRARGETFDILIIDPPSSARSKTGGHFSVKRDLKDLVREAALLVTKNGWLFASCNLAGWKNSAFLESVREGVRSSKRRIAEEKWLPQPFDFPAVENFPPYLKSVWMRLE